MNAKFNRIYEMGINLGQGITVRHGNGTKKNKQTKLFHFHKIFKDGWLGGGSSEPPEPPLNPPLTFHNFLSSELIK